MTARLSDAARLALPLAKHPTLAPERLARDFEDCPSDAERLTLWQGMRASIVRTLRKRGLTEQEIEYGIADLTLASREAHGALRQRQRSGRAA